MHAFWTFTGRSCKPRTPIANSPRCLYQSSIASFSHPPPTFDIRYPAIISPSATDAKSVVKRSKWEELMDSLSRNRANPSRVWNVYLELGSVMGFDDVPFEIQQQVLRKCVPPTDQLRVSAARRMQTSNKPRSPHIYESRLQTLVGHMRASGRKPTLEDYNFVLGQFAAVGHQSGARHVFREIIHLGLEPSYRTYGLCLQAIAHRLTLPCPYTLHSLMLKEANSICIELLDDMWARRIPMTSVNFDLAHRVFKETDSHATFERLLKIGYGIDLANPDRPPLEAQGLSNLVGGALHDTFKPLPFSPAALNTVIDMLGKTKQISRMVMAFEVFTTPMPPLRQPNPSEQACVDGQDDDDDDPAFYQFSSPEGDAPYEPPCATANTTTFNLLIRYAAKANHAVFSRHYVVQAMERDRLHDAQLRIDLASKPLSEIPSPNFAVNRATFLPPFGLANRTRHMAFLRWGFRQTSLAWKRKKEYLAFYTRWRRQNVPSVRSQDLDVLSDKKGHITPVPLEPTISATLSPSPSTELSTRRRTPIIPVLSEALQMDLESPPPLPPRFKPLDLDLHISLLTRDVEEIGELVQRMRAAVERLSQRLKERLGRRIWQGKNIFLASRNERVHVNRREWVGMVKFQTRREPRNTPGEQHVRTRPPTRRGHPPGSTYYT